MKDALDEKWFRGIAYLLLAATALSCLLPMLHIISLSLSDQQSVVSGRVAFWPQGWSMESYRMLFHGTRILPAFANSLVITFGGILLSMVFTIFAAYPLSRKTMYARRTFTLIIVFTMIFNGGMIPTFLVVKALGLLDSYGAIWFPSLVSAFNMLIMKNYFEQIPEEMEEAAKIDGCGEWRFLTQILLRVSLPVIAMVTLFYAILYWNSFFVVLIYIQDTEKYNLAVLVQQMLQSQSVLQEMNNLRPEDQMATTPEGIRSAGIMVMVIPMLLVYPFLQKYFIKGIMIGAIKG
ncbi:carbohydrate ABC transporter permease [Paenibacillus eucommiae]|uniref:Aldouronate transport system permease protein n=1 Tax=Paenibacillus eucommiae TaxID=1355755 RepID=A0ABS4IT36_9BACL|nr:carbohydrate ABC transporter permease [Paenibacillus eucommiae]MBP1990729.1 putative aldouronate transport system permease protein [Paenibacillus eucommiae]